jgi:hypothetical protein
MQGVISVVDRVDSLLVHDLARKAETRLPGALLSSRRMIRSCKRASLCRIMAFLLPHDLVRKWEPLSGIKSMLWWRMIRSGKRNYFQTSSGKRKANLLGALLSSRSMI